MGRASTRRSRTRSTRTRPANEAALRYSAPTVGTGSDRRQSKIWLAVRGKSRLEESPSAFRPSEAAGKLGRSVAACSRDMAALGAKGGPMRRLAIALGVVVVFGFAVLGWIGTRIYQEMPPIPERVVTTDGR